MADGYKPDINIKRLQLDIDSELHMRFKAVCSLRGEKMKPLIVEFIREWLDNNEPVWMKGQK
ncbi:hypothetical protein HA41_16000 [Pantoea conspicua]|uniref:ParG n=1 Tax=Pantoea conspicua TaxID=472705 RepID=A0A1X1BSQ9_9GAMM|nr:hypothetical protein HA41_16000 [Pantoea conspicua]